MNYQLVIADEGRVNQAELWRWLEEYLVQNLGGGFTVTEGRGHWESLTEPVRVYTFITWIYWADVLCHVRRIRDAFRQEAVHLVEIGRSVIV